VGSRPVNQPQAQAPTPSASNYSGIQRPKPVESNVKPVEINIPDFLKNPRR
jgi:cell division protein FtsZ